MKKFTLRTMAFKIHTISVFTCLLFLFSVKTFAQVVTASGENLPNEGIAKLHDGDINSKWLTFSSTAWVQFEFATPNTWNLYEITSGGDAPERDPKDWTIQGSNDGLVWVTLNIRTGQTWSARNQTRSFAFSNASAYKFYKWNITANGTGGGIIQASEFLFSTGTIIPVVSVNVSPSTASIGVGSSIQLAATILPVNASDPGVTWSSSNDAVASVDLTGKVTGQSEGTATVLATTVDGSKVNSSLITVTAPVASPTDVFEEIWTNSPGSSISDIPVSKKPDITIPIQSIEITPRNVDNYGVRIRGYIKPAVTGDYTFYVASDDNGEFRLSTDEEPVNKTRISYHTDWTNSREWTKYPTQQSAPQALIAGNKYFFEALMKQAGGGDNLAIGWTGPGIADITVIGAPYLEKYIFIDSVPPSAPTNLMASNIRGNSFNLAWNKSSDNNEVAEYVIYLNGDSISVTSDTTLKVMKLTPATTYSVNIKARDASGNLSAVSLTLMVTTNNIPVVEGFTEDFNDGDLVGWTGNSYTLANENAQLKVIANKENDPWAAFDYHFSETDISGHPFVTLKIKAKFDFNIAIAAGSGLVIDGFPKRIKTVDDLNSQEIVGGNSEWQEYTFDFTGVTAADLSSLDNLHFLLNPFANLSQGDSTIFYVEDLRVGNMAKPMPSTTTMRDLTFNAGNNITARKLPVYGITDGSDDTHVITITATSNIPAVVPNPVLEYVSPSRKGYITIKPNHNIAGSAVITITTSAPGVQDKIATFTVRVLPNQAPGLQTVTNLIGTIGQLINIPLKNVSDGDAEAAQAVIITATSDNQTVLADNKITVTHDPLSTSGTLGITSASGIPSGSSANIEIKLKDNGGTALNGTDSSLYTFNVLFYNVVNNAPNLNNPGTVRLIATTVPTSIPLTGITDGDDGTQNLSFTITTKGAGVGNNYTVGTVSNGNAPLNFTLTGTTGADTITVRVTDNGGAGNNGPQFYETTFIVIANPAPQTWYVDNFNDATLDGWSSDANNGNPPYTFIQDAGVLHIKTDIKSLTYPGAFVDLKGQAGGKYIDISNKKFLSFKLKALPSNTNKPGKITIALLDEESLNNGSYQRSMLPQTIPADGLWHDYVIDYSNIFYNKDGYFLDSTHIKGLLINIDCDYFNAYQGDYFMDDLKLGDSAEVKLIPKNHIDPIADVTLVKGQAAPPIYLTGITNNAGNTPGIKILSNNPIAANFTTTPVLNGTSTLQYTLTSNVTDSALVTVIADDMTNTDDLPDTVQFKIFVVDTASANNSEILITSTQTYQTMIGMGNTLPTNNAVGLQTTKDINATMLRVFGDFDNIEPQNDNADPYSLDFDRLNIDMEKVNQLKSILANTNCKKFFYTPLTPPVWMKNNKAAYPSSSTQWASNNRINPALYDEFAEFLVAVVRVFKEKVGTDLYAISIQNEPEFNEPYPSCQINGEEFKEIMKVVGNRFKMEGITTRIMMPEDVSLGWVMEKVDPVVVDPESKQYLDVIAVHNYGDNGITPGGANGSSWTNTRQYFESTPAKDLWMTETSGFTNKWEGELTEDYLNPGQYFLAPGPFGYGGFIFSALKFGHISAWVDLVGKENDKSIAAAFKQFSKFIEPGSVMIDATSADPDVLALAFKNSQAGNLSIILFNTSHTPKKIHLTGVGLSAYMQSYITANNINFEMSDSAVNGYYLMPARAIVSLTSLPIVVPVKLGELKAKKAASTTVLTWETYAEINNKGFYIQHSVDGVNFTTELGFVNSKALNGNSNSTNRYSFVDVAPVAGINYYRLKQTNFDGKTALSNIAQVRFDNLGSLRVANIYPNPISIQGFNVTVQSNIKDRIIYSIVDATGRKLMEQQAVITPGISKFVINTSSLAPGIYFFKVRSSNKYENDVQQFIKQ